VFEGGEKRGRGQTSSTGKKPTQRSWEQDGGSGKKKYWVGKDRTNHGWWGETYLKKTVREGARGNFKRVTCKSLKIAGETSKKKLGWWGAQTGIQTSNTWRGGGRYWNSSTSVIRTGGGAKELHLIKSTNATRALDARIGNYKIRKRYCWVTPGEQRGGSNRKNRKRAVRHEKHRNLPDNASGQFAK